MLLLLQNNLWYSTTQMIPILVLLLVALCRVSNRVLTSSPIAGELNEYRQLRFLFKETPMLLCLLWVVCLTCPASCLTKIPAKFHCFYLFLVLALRNDCRFCAQLSAVKIPSDRGLNHQSPFALLVLYEHKFSCWCQTMRERPPMYPAKS